MSFFQYTTPCPECQKESKEGKLGFDTDSGKICCDGENTHEFDNMPGETPAPATEEARPAAPHLEEGQSVPTETWTPEEEAALNEAMAHDPRPRDFGSQVVEAQDEVTAAVGSDPEPSGAQDGPILATDYSQCCVCHPGDVEGHYCDTHAAELQARIDASFESPRVGLGGLVVLSDGSALAGVRIDEKWVSAMQAEGENQTPPKNAAEYLQEIIDQGLINWHLAAPVAL